MNSCISVPVLCPVPSTMGEQQGPSTKYNEPSVNMTVKRNIGSCGGGGAVNLLWNIGSCGKNDGYIVFSRSGPAWAVCIVALGITNMPVANPYAPCPWARQVWNSGVLLLVEGADCCCEIVPVVSVMWDMSCCHRGNTLTSGCQEDPSFQAEDHRSGCSNSVQVCSFGPTCTQ